MKAAADILPEDVQKLFGEVEDYLENLQSESLSARARIQRDEILFDIEQLKERYQWGFLPGDENNIQKATEDQGIVLKQGYLEKRAKDSKIFGSEWQGDGVFLTIQLSTIMQMKKANNQKACLLLSTIMLSWLPICARIPEEIAALS
ncbi:src kinase-associated phosphoprotein 1-like [Thamnophis elegans]|uniref:src kinase-associated phosphoprotein 1-like n=1 Tax=Thamnophis elegans TaxID=35005 RepID=UPI0013771EB2|nr:src kinase-associated phosphoprotein 1-like [Thamnophis elegans]